MQLADVTRILEQKKRGQFFTIVTRRNAKTFKGTPKTIQKESTFQAILAEYANMKAVREAIEVGDRDTPALPSYVKEVFHVGGVKFWRGHNGNIYLPIPVNGNKPQVQWYMDNEPARFEDVDPFLLASEKTPKKTKEELAEDGQAPFVTVNIDNILALR